MSNPHTQNETAPSRPDGRKSAFDHRGPGGERPARSCTSVVTDKNCQRQRLSFVDRGACDAPRRSGKLTACRKVRGFYRPRTGPSSCDSRFWRAQNEIRGSRPERMARLPPKPQADAARACPAAPAHHAMPPWALWTAGIGKSRRRSPKVACGDTSSSPSDADRRHPAEAGCEKPGRLTTRRAATTVAHRGDLARHPFGGEFAPNPHPTVGWKPERPKQKLSDMGARRPCRRQRRGAAPDSGEGRRFGGRPFLSAPSARAPPSRARRPPPAPPPPRMPAGPARRAEIP